MHSHDLIPNYRDARKLGELYLFGEDVPIEIWTYNDEEDIIPHIHLHSPFMKYDICIRLDKAEYYEGHGLIHYILNNEQKKQLIDWFNINHKDHFGNNYTNWSDCLMSSHPIEELWDDKYSDYRKNIIMPNYNEL